MTDLTDRCPRCGRTVLWHRVYNTRAGIRAYCKDRKAPGKQPHVLDTDALDVWGRLHKVVVGIQHSLFADE